LSGFNNDEEGGLHYWASSPRTRRVDKEEGGREGQSRKFAETPTVSGDGMGQPSAVALLHLRRLDRFLKHHGLHRTADTYVRPLPFARKSFVSSVHLLQLHRVD
jgi:hypothetical protein